jgi:hypothetical protein
LSGSGQRSRGGRFGEVEHDAVGAEQLLELVERPRQRAAGVGTRQRQRRAPGGQQGETFGRGEP